jgi:hypothetical protein
MFGPRKIWQPWTQTVAFQNMLCARTSGDDPGKKK